MLIDPAVATDVDTAKTAARATTMRKRVNLGIDTYFLIDTPCTLLGPFYRRLAGTSSS
jgi:hypothetical protein